MCGVHSATSRSRKAKERRLRPLIRPRMSHGGRSADARIWGQTRSLGWSRRDMGTDTRFNLHACQNMGTDTESGLVTTRYGDRHEVQPPRMPEYGDRHEVQPHLPRVAARSPKAAGRSGAGGTPSL